VTVLILQRHFRSAHATAARGRASRRQSVVRFGCMGADTTDEYLYVERFDWDRVAQIFLEQITPFVRTKTNDK